MIEVQLQEVVWKVEEILHLGSQSVGAATRPYRPLSERLVSMVLSNSGAEAAPKKWRGLINIHES